MEMPTVQTEAHDPKLNIHYVVHAYRTLSQEEMLMTIRMLWNQKKSKRPKPNTKIAVTSLIGMHD